MAAAAPKKTSTRALMRKIRRKGELHAMTHAKNATTILTTRALSGGALTVATVFVQNADLACLSTTFSHAQERARASTLTARE